MIYEVFVDSAHVITTYREKRGKILGFMLCVGTFCANIDIFLTCMNISREEGTYQTNGLSLFLFKSRLDQHFALSKIFLIMAILKFCDECFRHESDFRNGL